MRVRAVACALAVFATAVGVNAPPTSPPRLARIDVDLTAASVQSPPGALITQFLANQVQNCSLICPFVVQGGVQVPTAVLLARGTFVTQLQSGQPLAQALGLAGATVSGPPTTCGPDSSAPIWTRWCRVPSPVRR